MSLTPARLANSGHDLYAKKDLVRAQHFADRDAAFRRGPPKITYEQALAWAEQRQAELGRTTKQDDEATNCSDYPNFLSEKDSGRELRLVDTGRFGFCLDERAHPLADMDLSRCPIAGYVSNWSLQGPRRYPIGYEVTRTGSCEIGNRDFRIQIVGITHEEAHPSS